MTLHNRTTPLSALALLMMLPLLGLSSSAGASGISSGGSNAQNAPREVDQVYEYGKAIYLGRAPGSKKISYCVKVDGQTRKLRGRTLRQYRGAKQLDFANALYNCKQPEQLALLGIEKEEVAYVMYYLNKRFRLELDTNR